MLQSFPKGSRFIKINTNDKGESPILDLLLDGADNTEIGLNGVQIPANSLEVTHLSFSGNIAFVVVSPRTAVVSESVKAGTRTVNTPVKTTSVNTDEE